MNSVRIESDDSAIFESVNSLKTFYRRTQESRVVASYRKVSYNAVMSLLDVTDLDLSLLCYLLGISGDDLRKIKESEQFTNEHCIKILTIAGLYGRGYTLFGNRRSFNHWMKYGTLPRGSVPPLSLLSQQTGLKEVDDALSRMERGSF
jgi:hypothetical protein